MGTVKAKGTRSLVGFGICNDDPTAECFDLRRNEGIDDVVGEAGRESHGLEELKGAASSRRTRSGLLIVGLTC